MFIKQQQPRAKQGNSGDELVNEGIRAKELLVITNRGEQLGVLSKQDALREAANREMDLVIVSPDSKPPVAKMMDYSKFRYEQQKRAKEMKKNQKIVQLKEIRLSPTIEKHDFDTKVRNAIKFLNSGDKVKISIRFIGRMIVHIEVGKKVMESFTKELAEISVVESYPKMEGKNLFTVLAPKSEK